MASYKRVLKRGEGSKCIIRRNVSKEESMHIFIILFLVSYAYNQQRTVPSPLYACNEKGSEMICEGLILCGQQECLVVENATFGPGAKLGSEFLRHVVDSCELFYVIITTWLLHLQLSNSPSSPLNP